MLDNKNVLITGGTGSIGFQLIKYVLNNYSPKVIRIYSRDETKQHNLSKLIKASKTTQLRYFIGDIRDKERLHRAMNGVDIIFHLAALKHVVSCEYNPFEAIKTNVIGLQNIIELSIDKNIDKFIFISTDKAATPCNTMGVTKLLGEKLVTNANFYKGESKTIFYSLRLGNVLGSRGSLLPLIESQIVNDLPISLTHREMTRYVIDFTSAIKFIIETLSLAQGGEVFVPRMVAIKIIDLIDILIEEFSKKHKKKSDKVKIEEVGMFVGEKLFEELFSIEESKRTVEIDNMYVIIPQLNELFKKIDVSKYPNHTKFDNNNPFNSKESKILTKVEIKRFLLEKEIINNEY